MIKLIHSKFNYLVKHPLFSGSAIMIIGTNFGNFLAYIYHLLFGRILEPAAYGELASTISLLGLVTVSFSFFTLVVVKFISSAEQKQAKIIFSWFFKKAFILAMLVGGLTFSISHVISNFLHIDYHVILLITPIIIFSVFALIYRSTLQGLLRFKEMVIVTNVEVMGRLLIGLGFVMLGFSTFGALLGFMIAAIIAIILSKHYLKDFKIFGVSGAFIEADKVFKYGVPIFIASLATNSFFSNDVILVKHFFSSYDAGVYASLSTLGKIIYFGASPVSAVMFPMISKRHSKGEGFRKIFFLSLLLTTAISSAVLVLYLLFPEIAIRLLYGTKYIAAAPYLFWMGVFMAIFTLGSLILNYFLSQNDTKASLFVLFGAFVQFVGIWKFHQNLLEVIHVSIVSSFIFLFTLLIYFYYGTRKSADK